MRVRTASANLTKAAALEPLFTLAEDRHLAWLRGNGRVYADLEKVATKHNYRVWSFDGTSDGDGGVWFAVRSDLVAEDGWHSEEESLSFDATRAGLGTVGLVGDSLFDRRNSVKVLLVNKPEEYEGFDYSETLYSAAALKN